MSKSKLSEHIFKKGKFITPWNSLLGDVTRNQSWCLNRYPEYIWLALILYRYGRKKGLEKSYCVLKKLHEISRDLKAPAFSLVLGLSEVKQNELFSYVVGIMDSNVLAPLTLLYTYSENRIFSKYFTDMTMQPSKRQEIITKVLQKGYMHQSEFATDIRFLVLFFTLLTGTFSLPKQELELILEYPKLEHSDEKMRIIRPSIRSMEMMVLNLEILDVTFLENFWVRISKMSDCKLFFMKWPENSEDANKYVELLYEVFQYYTDCFIAVAPLDKKTLVLLGLATYSYKRVLEIYEHNLYNSISARSSIRTVIENYIMMKYLIKAEESQVDIWEKYQMYGIGLYKVVVARFRDEEKELPNSHVDYKYLEILVNEMMDERFLDMDTSYFDKQNIRDKAISVGEKELFGLYYDYDSSFEHGLWGAIRESSLLKCDSPAHQYHCVPDYENKQNLKSVWPDCISTMNSTIKLLNEFFSLPESLLNEVMKFDK